MAYAADLSGVLAELAAVGLGAASVPDTDDKLLTLQSGAYQACRTLVQSLGVDPDGLTSSDSSMVSYLENLLTVEAAHRAGQFQLTREQAIGVSQRIATARFDTKAALPMGGSSRLAASRRIRSGSMTTYEDATWPETT